MTTHDQKLLRLKKHMNMNNMLPGEGIIIDNQRHIYWAINNGLRKQASYIATRNPLGRDGPRLICSYGLVDGKAQFSYSSSE